MKKLYQIVFVTAAVLTGCAKHNVDTPPNGTPGGEITFRGIASTQETRVVYESGETALRPSWVKDDLVGLFAESGGVSQGANVSYKTMSAGRQSDFAASSRYNTITWADETSAHDFYAYYPYNEDAGTDWTAIPVSVPAVQEQVGRGLDHLGTLDFMYVSTKGVTPGEEVVELSFEHLFSVLEVNLTSQIRTHLDAVIFRCKNSAEVVSLEGAKVNLRTGQLDVSDAVTSPQVRLDCSYATFPYQGSLSAYMLITPGHAGQEFEVVAVINGKERTVATKKVPAAGIPAGKTAVISAAVVADPEDELEVINLSAGGLANSYIVSKPNTLYRFNAKIKGNGVERNYKWDGKTFSYSKSDMRIYPKSALVLWYNCEQTSTDWKDESPVVVSSVELGSDGYIYFDTPGQFVNGNVVIAAFAEEWASYNNIEVTDSAISNATILWSWNIWAVEDYDPKTDAKNITTGGYTIMGRNMGAIVDYDDVTPYGADNHVRAAGLAGNYYQWGRKDPFPYFATYAQDQGKAGSQNSLNYTPTYTPIIALQHTVASVPKQILPAGSIKYQDNFDNNIADAIKNPHRFMGSEGAVSQGTWYSGTGQYFRALWGAPRADTSGDRYAAITATAKNDGLKSIYDPCPAGWKVWDNGAMLAVSALTPTIAVTGDYGISVGGGFFPIIVGRGEDSSPKGYLPINKGSTHSIYNYTANSNTYAGRWGFPFNWETQWVDNKLTVSKFATPNSEPHKYLSEGQPVRCIKDTEEGVTPDPDVPQFDGNDPQIEGMDKWTGWE